MPKQEPQPARLEISTNGSLVRLYTAANETTYLQARLLLTRAEARELAGKLEDVLVTGDDAEMEVSP